MDSNNKLCMDEVSALVTSVSGIIPAQRALHKAGFSFSKEPFESQRETWNHIWKNSGYRLQLHAFFFLERWLKQKELMPMLWETSVSWQDSVDDWPLCDGLSKINTKALETYPEKVYPQLVLWNQSDNLWKRRQSVVSLLYYSRTKKTFLPFSNIEAQVEPLLKDKEYYVQKGIGWTLREMYTVYPDETFPFLKKHIKDLSPIAFTISIEKMAEAYKDELKRLRKIKKV